MKTANSIVSLLLDSEDVLSPEEAQGFIEGSFPVKYNQAKPAKVECTSWPQFLYTLYTYGLNKGYIKHGPWYANDAVTAYNDKGGGIIYIKQSGNQYAAVWIPPKMLTEPDPPA